MEHTDYYQTLEIENDAAAEKIKEAYRSQALKYHPDRNNGDPEAAEKMKSINEAYAVLSDPEKRQTYDLMRDRYGSSAYSQFRQNYTDEDIFRDSDINRIFEELARSFGLRGFDDSFKEAYGNGYKTFQFRNNGMNGSGYVLQAIWEKAEKHYPVSPYGEAGKISGMPSKK